MVWQGITLFGGRGEEGGNEASAKRVYDGDMETGYCREKQRIPVIEGRLPPYGFHS
jgi:hypothetical protein